MALYPGALDDSSTLPDPGSGSLTTSPDHAGLHTNENTAIKAIELKIGTGASTPTASKVLRSAGTGTSIWGQVALVTDVTGTLPVANGGTGQTNLAGLTLPNPTITNPTITTGGSWSGSPTITTPTIASFTNAQHTHANAAGGGKITALDVSVAAISNPYKFAVYPSSTVAISSNPQKVAFNTKLFDTNTNFDAVTNFRYTVPVSGYYQINVQVGMGSAGANSTESLQCALYKNSSLLKYSQQIVGSGSVAILPRPSISTLVQLVAGDFLEVYAVPGGIYRDIVGGSTFTFFEGYLVSNT